MINATSGPDDGRFSIEDELTDPLVRQGYGEQGAVVEAASLVRRMRDAAGLSQAALAALLGTSQAHLSMLERGVGRHGPTFLMLRKIAAACGQTLDIAVRPAQRPVVPTERPVVRTVAGFGGAGRFRPLHDRVVVRRLAATAQTAGGIVIPDAAREKPLEGEVVTVSQGARNEQGAMVALEVKAGDKVLFGKWSGTEVKLDGEELLIMKESDIMGVVA